MERVSLLIAMPQILSSEQASGIKNLFRRFRLEILCFGVITLSLISALSLATASRVTFQQQARMSLFGSLKSIGILEPKIEGAGDWWQCQVLSSNTGVKVKNNGNVSRHLACIEKRGYNNRGCACPASSPVRCDEGHYIRWDQWLAPGEEKECTFFSPPPDCGVFQVDVVDVSQGGTSVVGNCYQVVNNCQGDWQARCGQAECRGVQFSLIPPNPAAGQPLVVNASRNQAVSCYSDWNDIGYRLDGIGRKGTTLCNVDSVSHEDQVFAWPAIPDPYPNHFNCSEGYHWDFPAGLPAGSHSFDLLVHTDSQGNSSCDQCEYNFTVVSPTPTTITAPACLSLTAAKCTDSDFTQCTLLSPADANRLIPQDKLKFTLSYSGTVADVEFNVKKDGLIIETEFASSGLIGSPPAGGVWRYRYTVPDYGKYEFQVRVKDAGGRWYPDRRF